MIKPLSLPLAALLLSAACVVPAAAKPVSLDAVYTADVSAVAAGGADHRVRYLDNLDLIADADLGELTGWHGAKAHVYVLNNMGARTNNAAGTLQGVDNIEVSRAALRLFEAWLEQDLGHGASLRAGMIDLNSEFNASQVSDQLIAPSFGISPEISSTGSNGPSIFPSTSLAARVAVSFGEAGYVRAGLFNARASTLGDVHGIDLHFREGVLAIGEAGVTLGKARVDLGGWAYSKKRDALFATDANGDPLQRSVGGAYAGVEGEVGQIGEGRLSAMLRGGFAQGDTTPFDRAGQAALKLAPFLPGRSDSLLSFGLAAARTSADFRSRALAAGDRPVGSEVQLELTVADRLLPFLTVQPDVQVVFHPGGLAATPTALVTALRLTFSLRAD
jgi:porin